MFGIKAPEHCRHRLSPPLRSRCDGHHKSGIHRRLWLVCYTTGVNQPASGDHPLMFTATKSSSELADASLGPLPPWLLWSLIMYSAPDTARTVFAAASAPPASGACADASKVASPTIIE